MTLNSCKLCIIILGVLLDNCLFSLTKYTVYMFVFFGSDIIYDACRSALRSFKRRVAYANANYDRILFKCYVSLLLIFSCNCDAEQELKILINHFLLLFRNKSLVNY